MSSKNCDFCNFSRNCEQIGEIAVLLKLIKSSVTGGRRAPSKNCNFSKNCEKLEKSQLLLKLITTSVRGGTMYKGAQQKLQFLQFLQKLQKIGEIAVFAKIN